MRNWFQTSFCDFKACDRPHDLFPVGCCLVYSGQAEGRENTERRGSQVELADADMGTCWTYRWHLRARLYSFHIFQLVLLLIWCQAPGPLCPLTSEPSLDPHYTLILRRLSLCPSSLGFRISGAAKGAGTTKPGELPTEREESRLWPSLGSTPFISSSHGCRHSNLRWHVLTRQYGLCHPTAHSWIRLIPLLFLSYK